MRQRQRLTLKRLTQTCAALSRASCATRPLMTVAHGGLSWRFSRNSRGSTAGPGPGIVSVGANCSPWPAHGLATVPLFAACAPAPKAPQPTPALGRVEAAPGRAPAADQLSLLLWSHFVPDFDKWFDTFAQDWGIKNGVQVRVDHVPQAELPARASAELASQTGHDIIQFVATGGPHLYARHLDDLDDVINRLDQEHGGWSRQLEISPW